MLLNQILQSWLIILKFSNLFFVKSECLIDLIFVFNTLSVQFQFAFEAINHIISFIFNTLIKNL